MWALLKLCVSAAAAKLQGSFIVIASLRPSQGMAGPVTNCLCALALYCSLNFRTRHDHSTVPYIHTTRSCVGFVYAHSENNIVFADF